MSISTLAILTIIGLSAGILSGMIGVGGGIVIVPALVYFLGLTQHEAQGTSLAMMIPPIGILAVYNYYKADQVNMKYALILAAFFVVGGYLGSKITIDFIDEKTLKKFFGSVMLMAAIKMIFFSK
ncbi:MAG TPA: permease [Flavobacteriales bacterium]|nr:permease [Flavobacteriales bacterium]|tara:strand:+ start:25990 stop:26364 length:375 start_codon:yes stop_codon:yes gene_type:complete